MKITFVLPSLNLTGGLRVIGIYAEYLSKKGHDVTVLFASARKPKLKYRVKSFFQPKKTKQKPSCPYFNHGLSVLREINFLGNYDVDQIPDADVIIATFWVTAEWIESLPVNKGKKIYFLQHYELHPWLPIERVKATFQLPYKRIVVSGWIKENLEKIENCKVDHVILNGVSSSQFYAEQRSKNDSLTIGFMFSPREYKGCNLAIEAIKQVQRSVPNLKVITFASEQPSDDFFLEDFVITFVNPEQNKLKDIYSKCDAWIFSSLKEGFGLPILEAMACRTPVIGTPAGAATSLITEDNGVLLDSFDSDAIAKAIMSIHSLSNAEWQNMSENAYRVSTQYSWQNSGDAFEKALKEYIQK